MYLHTRNLIFFETLYSKKTKIGERYSISTKFIHIDLTTELNEDETFQSAMTYEEDQKLILNTEKEIAFNNGISTGIQEAKEEVVIGMLKKNLELNLISEITGLNEEEIEEIKKNIF